ncbi:PREDICTED: heterogeneous nuclear ribonucleoprotein C-like isoform X1 [Drosophila arizonae]|uniref:Heterogeneous nuclear ribonucleoprotein C-like isoform X1 n=1 Tax=Drosophila arizonae TaxID=7263 RepID=A0ABM1P9X5_DROAR|nr:PREDICTED: heterogeneous nuclear ribonucleoprotein C-like isoform X1 [Drosophila arizonae]
MKLSKLSNQTNSQDPQAVNSRIFVGNLNTFQCSKTDVERMFQIYGRLAGISMHKGYAFVQFTNPFDARNACHGEDGKTVLSQTLDVNMVAEPKAHQIGRKRQNVSKTGNDWDYFYDSYCSSALLRGGGGGGNVNGVRAKKRKRLMTNNNGLTAAVQQQQQHSQHHHSAAAVAAAAAAAAVHHQQQAVQQQQQQVQQQQQLPQQQQSLRSNVAQLSPSDPAAGAEEETCSEECATTDRDVKDDEEDDEDKCDNTTLEPTQCTQANATQAGKATTPQVESLTIRVDPNRNLTKTTAQPKTTAAAGKQTKPQSTAPTKFPFAQTTKSKKAKKPCCIKPAKKPRNSLSQNLRKVWQEPKQRIDRASPSDKANLRIDAIATWLQYRKMHSKDALRLNRATRQQRDKKPEVKKSKKYQIWAKKKPRKQRGVVDRKQVLQAETKLWPLKGSH